MFSFAWTFDRTFQDSRIQANCFTFFDFLFIQFIWKRKTSFTNESVIVRRSGSSPPPSPSTELFYGTQFLTQLAFPLFKIFVSPLLFSAPPPFKVFQTVPPPSRNTPIFQTVPPLTLIQYTNILNKHQKGDFTSSIVAFYQKPIFDFLNPFTNISGYLKFMGHFQIHF